jgi:hypothetical protein
MTNADIDPNVYANVMRLSTRQSAIKAHRADAAQQSGAGNLAARFAPWKPIFCLDNAPHPDIGHRNWEGRMLANVFSNNTTPPRVEKAEGVPLIGLALSLCLMAAIAALAFVACAAL